MSTPLKDVKKITDEYTQEYMFQTPYDKYINGVGISKLELLINTGSNIELFANDKKRDFCIDVTLVEEPPKEVRQKLPDRYKGVRVVYEIIGEIKIQ